MHARKVLSVSPDGDVREELVLSDRPSGLGWTPGGDLIISSMDERLLLVASPGKEPNIHADLNPLCGDVAGHLNDMVVSPDGDAYVGFDPDYQQYGFQSPLGLLIHVDPQGRASVAGTGLMFPNGVVIDERSNQIVVAETGRPRLTGFPFGSDGKLGEPIVWADLDLSLAQSSLPPELRQRSDIGLDGCAIDAAGCIWASDSHSNACLRIARSGQIMDAVFLPEGFICLACALGGTQQRTLLLCGLNMAVSPVTHADRSELFIVDLP